MKRTLDAWRAGRLQGYAQVGLRSDHPLLRASEAVRYTFGQCSHVAAILIGSVIALLEGEAWAAPLAGSAAGVLLILGVLLAAHLQRRRDCAIGLILEGSERVPVAAVQRQRRRLLSTRTRDGLAFSLQDMLEEVSGGPKLRLRVAPSLFEPSVVRAVANELRDVIVLLRTEQTSARGVARAERLVEHAISPLYGQDAGALREELGRVRELLGDAGDGVSGREHAETGVG